MSYTHVGCPIRKSTDQWLFAPTRCLSQLITSFIASESQGIRHAPLLTFFLLVINDRAVSLIRNTIPLFFFFCSFNMSKIDMVSFQKPTGGE